MGKKKLAIIDDSQPEVEKKKKDSKKRVEKSTKSSELKATGEVEQSSQEETPTQIATEPEAPRDDKPKKSQKPGKAKPRSRKYQEKVLDLDRSKTYPISDAVDMVKKLNYAKFNATIEAHINTAALGIRGLVSLPFASGKTEYKTEAKAPVIHLGLGKLDQPTEELSANIKILLQTVGKTRIKKVTLSPTMGPSVKVDLASI